MPNNELTLFKGNRFAEIVLSFPCSQKILMVTDGSLSFGIGFFGLSEFVGIITGAGHSVSTAHRNAVLPATIPGNFNFATAATPVTTANYDQIWLFGFNSAALSAPQQTTIAQFMDNGGGVFATGDHETLGAGMGNNIPRVRKMRNWATIPMTNPDRLDTVLEPGVDNIKQFDDQADAIPQRIYPKFFSNGGPDTAAASWSVHPVLRHPSGAVDCLPDHPHESECLAPVPVAGSFAGFQEWPTPTGGGRRIAPQVVAISISAGRFIFSGGTKPPVSPRCFGAISVYDGDAAAVGRIVCDATWHHFVNINLNGSGATPDTTGAPRTGLYAGGAATPEYLKIQRYYLNTVRWLAPIGRRNCWPFLVATLVRFDPEMLEWRLPEPHPCPWDPLIRIGLIAEEAVTRYWGPGALADVVDDMLTTTKGSPTLTRLLKAQQRAYGEGDKRSDPSLLPLHDLRRAILGSVVNVIADKLPADEERLADLMRGGHDDLAAKLIAEGIRGAEKSIDDYLSRAVKNTVSLANALKAKK